MKYRSLTVFSTLLLAGLGASAQSNVTVYGVADVYVQIGNGGSGSASSVQSGGVQGSRVGFEGSEDLGSGLRAVFQLETGLALDTGTVTQGGTFWGRHAYVGLSSADFGSLTVGRQCTPLFIAADAADPFSTGLGSVVSSGIMTLVGGPRANNSVVYATPTWGGFSSTWMAAAGEGVKGRSFGADLRYASEKLMVALTLTQQDPPAAGMARARSALLSGAYDFGAFKLMGAAQAVKHANFVATQDDRQEFYIGAQVPIGAGTVQAVYGGGKTKGIAGSKASELSLGYDHALSKRTNLYVIGSRIDNGTLTAFTTDGSTGSGPSAVTGHGVSAVQVGMRHRF